MMERPYTESAIVSQAKLYDKIVKENMQKVLPELIRDVLNIDIVHSEELSESLQHTKERIPDQLCKVTDADGNTFILHVEWQSDDDPAMDNRMLSYRAMLRRKYALRVKQYVIFLPRVKSRMPYRIDEENLKFSYHLIVLQEYSHQIFLNSTSPEQQLLAIFGNFESVTPVEVIRKIVVEVTSTAEGQLNADRYIEQLRALVQLRKLNKEFKIAMGTITKFNYHEDAFYLDGIEKGMEKGIEKGIEKKSREVIENLIIQLGFSDEQAAQLTKTSISFVQQVRHAIEAKGTKL